VNDTFIIAEAGVNHNGDITLAEKLIDVAAESKANAVKFQTFKPDALVTRNTPKAAYQKALTGETEGQLQMLRKLALSAEDHQHLKRYCEKRDITFLSSPFDLESIEFLLNLGISLFKIPSGEITNLPYLRKIGESGLPVILSTGMSLLDEVAAAANALVSAGTPQDQLILLHCNSQYPTAFHDVNLRAMMKMGATLGCPVGYSDHTPGIEVPIAAVALGAIVIEKHFTLSKDMEGPDHKASLDPEELKLMVQGIRNIEESLGSSEKKPTTSEEENRGLARKSLVAARTIVKGEVFSAENLTAKRPGTGTSPMEWDDVIGKTAERNYEMDEPI